MPQLAEQPSNPSPPAKESGPVLAEPTDAAPAQTTTYRPTVAPVAASEPPGQAGAEGIQPAEPTEELPAVEPLPVPDGPHRSEPVSVSAIVQSIHATFPLLEAAYQQNRIAAANQVAAWGAFDTKLKAASLNGALGYYENYRQSTGLAQPLFGGGELIGGYRIGRGDFQPWYLERQTNGSGELKAGISLPLLRNRDIDARRAELWRANYDRLIAEPDVRAQLIGFVRDGTVAYWQWIAAGRKCAIGQRALSLAKQRNDQLRRKVQVGDVDPPVLQDNLRAIAKREAKLIDLQRKLQQSAVKLSLFYRTGTGDPIVPQDSQLLEFPAPQPVTDSELESDVATALSVRPELRLLDALAGRVNVDMAAARNDLLPSLDAQLVGSQDMGTPTSSKKDKSPFELEAGLLVEMPVQRRKARGKLQASQAKLTQIAAKKRFTIDKIRAEIQSAHVALDAAYERLGRARESTRLAEYMAEVERRKFELGQGDLLSVALREQYAVEAAEAEVDALLEFFTAQADYDAAMGRDGLMP